MKVVLLCGGQGTRLREETEYRPKPMVEVGGKPILWHIMRGFLHHGFDDFVLCLGYRGSVIKEYFLNYSALSNDLTIRIGQSRSIKYHQRYDEEPPFSVTLADTGEETMTGGRLSRVGRYGLGDTFIVTYGDGLSDVSITDLIAFHKKHGKLATVTAFRPRSRYGLLNIDEDGLVRDFSEKPTSDGWISAGFFVFDRRVLEYCSSDADCILEREPMRKLAADGELVSYRHDGFFFAMDTYREYLQLNEMWDSGEAPWASWRTFDDAAIPLRRVAV